MKKSLLAVIIIGYLFWGAFLFNGLVNMHFYNGLFTKYEFNCIIPDSVQMKPNRSNYSINYTYTVSNIRYNENYSVNEGVYSKSIKNKTVQICYNVKYPKYSYIQGANFSLRKHKVSVSISLIFIVIITVFGLIAMRDYWLNKYKDFMNRL